MKIYILILVLISSLYAEAQTGTQRTSQSNRVQFAHSLLEKELVQLKRKPQKENIKLAIQPFGKKEGFRISCNGDAARITGNDENGLLYGVLEFITRLREKKAIPQSWTTEEAPEMVLRGQCIGVQKPYYLPGHNVYEYPYTPETFPWFYDKAHWIQVLDSMLINRMNSLYLWNGHPFASLVKLKDYPYAAQVDFLLLITKGKKPFFNHWFPTSFAHSQIMIVAAGSPNANSANGTNPV